MVINMQSALLDPVIPKNNGRLNPIYPIHLSTG